MKEKLTRLSQNIILNEDLIVLLSCIFFSILSLLVGIYSSPDLLLKWMTFVKNYISNISFDFISVFINNISISAFMIAGGLLFAIPTVFFAGLNFFSLGATSKYFLDELGTFYIFSILPHGILEVCGIFLSFFFGMKIFKFSFLKKIKQNIETLSKLKKYLLIVFPIFFISALIEVYITPMIIQYIMQFFIKS